MPRCSALRNASATASGITSTAVTSQSGRSLASAGNGAGPGAEVENTARRGWQTRQRLLYQTFGIRAGISVAGETNSGSDQNSRCPTR